MHGRSRMTIDRRTPKIPGRSASDFFVGGERVYSLSCMAVVVRPQTLASLKHRDGARRAFIDQADTACTKREAP